MLRTILAADLDEIEALNLLQANGIISDHCVTIGDIADADVSKAIEFIFNR